MRIQASAQQTQNLNCRSNNPPSDNSAFAMDALIAKMEESLRNTREEFKRELVALRNSIAPMNAADNNIDTQWLDFNLYKPYTNQNNYSFNSHLFSDGPNVNLDKWKISFNGSGSVADFRFKVETLKNRTRCSNEYILANFHVFLENKANQWYWLFMKQNPEATYQSLKNALTKEFGLLESEHDILLKVVLRKQLHKESYDDFRNALVLMNSRMRSALLDHALINIIKRNLQPDLRFLLFSYEAKTLNDFRYVARKVERVLRNNKSTGRNISVLDSKTIDDSLSEVSDTQIDALQFPKKGGKIDYTGIKCWNCLSTGHSYIYCDKDVLERFCFKCGDKGVLTPSCPKGRILQGNRKLGEMATGNFRPLQKPPNLKLSRVLQAGQ